MTYDGSTQTIQRLMAEAAQQPPPPMHATPEGLFRAGVRRRRRRHWLAGAATIAVVILAAGGASALVGHGGTGSAPADPDFGGAPSVTATPTVLATRGATVEPGGPGTCAQLAADVAGAAGAALPDLRFSSPRLPQGAATADCATGGLFWFTVTRGGVAFELGFEGGSGVSGQQGCDSSRSLKRCDVIPGGEIGHIDGGGEFGVLFERGDVYFYLGLSDPRTDRLTTDELAEAATRIADVVFG
jgi:hypothetical protein